MAKKTPLAVYSGLSAQLTGTDYTVPYDRFIRVDKSGDDTNFAASSWDKPKLTLASAITLATISGGDWTIYMGRGTFIENSGVQLGNGSGGWQLVGAGRGQTIIQSSLDLTASNKAILAPGNNSFIRGITVHGTASNVAPFGLGTSNANATGTIIVEDCEFYSDSGGSDGMYFNFGATSGSFYVYRTKVLTGGDGVLSVSPALVELHDCEIISDGSSASLSNGVKNNSGTPVRIFGGMVSGDDNSIHALTLVEAYGVRFVPGTGTPYLDVKGANNCRLAGCARNDGASLVTDSIAASIGLPLDYIGVETSPDFNRIIKGDHGICIPNKLTIPNGVSYLVENGGVLMIL